MILADQLEEEHLFSILHFHLADTRRPQMNQSWRIARIIHQSYEIQ
jgi:hypothetical protein